MHDDGCMHGKASGFVMVVYILGIMVTHNILCNDDIDVLEAST